MLTKSDTSTTRRWKKFTMKRALPALVVSFPLLVRADANSLQPVSDASKLWTGKTVAVTARPPARFMAYSRAMLSLGLLGIAAAAADGKQIRDHNAIENPAPQVTQVLLAAAQQHYGVSAAAPAPMSVASEDAAAGARAAHGADLVFDVEPTGGSLQPLLRQSGRYFVTSDLRFRVIDVPTGRVIGDATRVRTTQHPELPTRDELLAERGARLKAILGAQRDFCLEFFKVLVLGATGIVTLLKQET